MPRMWISGSTAPHRVRAPRRRLEIAHGVDRRPVDPRLEVDVRSEAVPRAARGADDLPLGHALADGDPDARLVAVARGERAAVVDAGVVAVAADPAGDDHAAALGRVDRGARRHRDVDAGVQAAPAHAERGDDRAVDGPDQPARAGSDRARLDRPGAALDGGDARLDPAVGGLERGEVALEVLAAVARAGERLRLVG